MSRITINSKKNFLAVSPFSIAKGPYALMELLASDDNTNYASYLLNFGLALFFLPTARYKACRGMWKFSQLSAKNISVKNNAK